MNDLRIEDIDDEADDVYSPAYKKHTSGIYNIRCHVLVF